MIKFKLIILFLLLQITSFSQKLEFKDLKFSDEHLYDLHLTAGIIIGSTSTTMYYQWTGKKTLSFILGTSTGILAGHLKELYDVNQNRTYSKKDLIYTGIGSLLGSATIRITLGKYKRLKDLSNKELLQTGSYYAIYD